MNQKCIYRIVWCILCGLIAVSCPRILAVEDIRAEPVHFKKGANSAVIDGKIKGYETVDYLLDAKAGQTMNVSLATQHRATYFNILAPGENQVAFYNGSMNQNQYEGTLSISGKYKVRVYIMRAAARRNELAAYRLEMIISTAKASASVDAKVPGTQFHATGEIPCATVIGQPESSCPFGVERAAGGKAKIFITRANAKPRVIIFDKNRPIGYLQSEVDTGAFSAKKESDINIIEIGAERYKIPDAVVQGG